jgi:peptidyl-prolyl cis-trans isomerase A (cyclophilin A)
MMMQCRSIVAAVALAAALTPALAQKVRLDTSMGAVVFHRVIDGFMVQGGGMKADMNEKPTRPPIVLEAGNGLSNQRGTVAMARTANPNSATAQFFINVADNSRLDTAGGGYAVFGKVTEGMGVIDKIKAVPVADKAGHQNVPVEPVLIKKATLEK